MNPATRTLLRITVDGGSAGDADAAPAGNFARQTAQLVETLMGRRPELRFAYIQEHARFVADVDV